MARGGGAPRLALPHEGQENPLPRERATRAAAGRRCSVRLRRKEPDRGGNREGPRRGVAEDVANRAEDAATLHRNRDSSWERQAAGVMADNWHHGLTERCPVSQMSGTPGEVLGNRLRGGTRPNAGSRAPSAT